MKVTVIGKVIDKVIDKVISNSCASELLNPG